MQPLAPSRALQPAPQVPPASRPYRLGIAIVVGLLVLLALSALSLLVGSGKFTPTQVWQALQPSGSSDPTVDLLIRQYRLPRTIIAIAVGASLGVAGTIMQALTRNPLADPGILGVNAGAYTGVVLAAGQLGTQIHTTHVLYAMGGAVLTAAVVYVIGTTGPGSHSSAKLLLTGVAVAAVLNGSAYAISVLHPQVFDRVRYWNLGSLQGKQIGDLYAVLPFLGIGLIVGLALPRALNALSMGDDVAVALGSKPLRIRLAGLVAITLLCAGATALAGPIGFLGLMVPHLLRLIVGPSYTRLLPLSLLVAPSFLLAADIAGRFLVAGELPAGIVTALLGAPVLIYLARAKGVRQL